MTRSEVGHLLTWAALVSTAVQGGQGERVVQRLVVVVFVALLAACGGSDDTDSGAEQAVVETIEQRLAGQWAPLYQTLHPAHQELVSREDFLACADDVLGHMPAARIRAVDSHEERTTIPATDVETDSMAVTIEISAGDETATTTAHTVEVDGEWRWILSEPLDFDDCGEPSA